MNGWSFIGSPISTIKVNQMTTKDILELDFRDDKSYMIMQKVLKKIDPLANIEGKVPIEKLEKLLFLFQRRYCIEFNWIFVSHEDEQPVYTISMRNTYTDVGMGYVHGITLYEVVSKAVVAIWSHIKAKRLKKRKD